MPEGFQGDKAFWEHDPANGTIACRNCGKQKPYGRPSGLTYARADGTPCRHEYGCDDGFKKCKHCPDQYQEAF